MLTLCFFFHPSRLVLLSQSTSCGSCNRPASICLATSAAAVLPMVFAVFGEWPCLRACFLALFQAALVALCLKVVFLRTKFLEPTWTPHTHTYHLPTGCKKNVQPKFKIFGVFLGVLSESSSFPSFSSFCGLGQPSPPYLNLSACIGQNSTLYQHASFLLSSLLWLQVSSFWSSCAKFLQHSTIS